MIIDAGFRPHRATIFTLILSMAFDSQTLNRKLMWNLTSYIPDR